MIMKRIGFFCVLAAALLTMGCAATPDYYAGLKDQRDTSAESSYRDGLALMGTQEYRSAMTEFKKAIQTDQYLTDAYLGLSRSCFATGDYDMALYYRAKYAERKFHRLDVQYFPLD